VAVAKKDGTLQTTKVTKLYAFEGLERTAVEKADCGEIVALAGFEGIGIGETVTSVENPSPLDILHVDEPTLSMIFSVNTSPFAGKDGPLGHLAQHPRAAGQGAAHQRLHPRGAHRLRGFLPGDGPRRAAARDPHRDHAPRGVRALDLEPGGPHPQRDGKRKEPLELFVIDVPEAYMGVVLEKMAMRKGKMVRMVNHGSGRVRLEFHVPTRGLIGVRTELMTDTRGTAVLNSLLDGWIDWQGEIARRPRACSWPTAPARRPAYTLNHLEERGELFVGAGTSVYEGMIVGENARPADMDVNVTKAKKLTNMRASTADEAVRLTPHRVLNLEQALEFINQDELVEVTPVAIRIRKRVLAANMRPKRKVEDATPA
jgi:GTP-binding protein